MGRDKWAELGLEYQLEDTAPPSADSVDAVRATFRSRGLTVF
jgi:pyruvate formate lyase activating enzyme